MVTVDQVIVGGYLAAVLAIGLYFSRSQDSSDTFYLAGRDLGRFHVFGTTFSTFVGSGMAFTIAAFGYQYGISSLWPMLGLLTGFILFSRFAPRLKELSDVNDSITLPGLMNQKWDTKTTLLASVITVLIFTLAVSTQLIVAANILKIAFSIPLQQAIIGFGILIIAYTLLGGFLSVTWSDILQLLLVFVSTFFVLFPLSLLKSGGLSVIGKMPPHLLDPFYMDPTVLVGLVSVAIIAMFGSQDVFQRVYASKNGRHAYHGILGFGLAVTVFSFFVVFLGMIARVMFPDISPDSAIAVLIQNNIPVGLVGLTLAGYLAIANSTADSQLLTACSNLMHDFYEVYLGEPDDEKKVKYNRMLVGGVGLIAIGIAIAIPGLVEIFFNLASLFGILAVVVLLSLFRDIEENAAFLGLISGLAVATAVALAGNLRSGPLAGIVSSTLVAFLADFALKKLNP